MWKRRYSCGCAIAAPWEVEPWEGETTTFPCPAHAEPAPEAPAVPRGSPLTPERVMEIDEANERRERQQAWGWYDRPAPVRFRR